MIGTYKCSVTIYACKLWPREIRTECTPLSPRSHPPLLPGTWRLHHRVDSKTKDDSLSISYGLGYDGVPPEVRITRALLTVTKIGSAREPVASKSLVINRGKVEGGDELGVTKVSTSAVRYILELSLDAEVDGAKPTSSIPRLFAASCLNLSTSQIPVINDIKFVFPLADSREIWARSDVLSDASPYFESLFASDLEEEPRAPRSSVKMDKSSRATKRKFIDSDDEVDDETGMYSTPTVVQDSGHPFRQVIVKEASFTTYSAVINWIQSHQIEFSPLSSTFSDPSERLATIHSLTEPSQSPLPHPASPKSVYRLAHFLQIPELMEIALKNLSDQLRIENVGHELVGDVSRSYPEVQGVFLEYAHENWDKVKVSEAMVELEKRIDSNEVEGSAGVAVVLLKLAKRLKRS